MRIARKFIALASALGLAGLALAQAPKPWFSLTISVPQNVVKVGSNVTVNVAMKNISDHDIGCGGRIGFLGVDYDIVVSDSGGRPMPEGEFLREQRARVPTRLRGRVSGGSGSEVSCTLKPGQVHQNFFIANLARDMTKPGTYTIQISQTVYASNEDAKAGRKVVVKSNKLTVRVTN
jgi:hypothetical protein